MSDSYGVLVDGAAITAWAAVSFPGVSWSDAEVRHGAFHHVLVGRRVVARITYGSDHRARSERELGIARSLQECDLGVAVPQFLSDPVSREGRTGWLQTRLPGRNDSPSEWVDLRSSYHRVLAALAEIEVDFDLPVTRAWCGGMGFPALVSKQLSPLLGEHGPAAISVVEAMLLLPPPPSPRLVHGDFGRHNLLWLGQNAVSLIDFDHACLDDPALDYAPLIGLHGAQNVRDIASDETVTRAMTHRATLSLQIAAAAHLVGDAGLRDHALGNFVRRNLDHTLYDPAGESP